ncbi:MAG: hypothetical protein GY719_00090 [bacterium]|nr:hypothetical protein [bacterium]
MLSAASNSTSARPYWVSAAFCAVLVAIPFLAVTIPPITDLPQQTAQIRLLSEALEGEDAYRIQVYRIQWWHPNKLGYVPLLVTWAFSSPLAAGRLGVLLIGLVWVGALHALARATGRPAPAAALASVFFFNHLTYWGLLNFVLGLPVFALWFVLLDRLPPEGPGWREGWKLSATAMLLYCAHVLWLAGGLIWLMAGAMLNRAPLLGLARRLAWVAPAPIAALLWYPQLQTSGFVSETFWGRSPLGRLHPEWWLNSALGGLEGKVEPILGIAIVGWLLIVVSSRLGKPPMNKPEDGFHRGLLAAGLLFTAAALCLPAVIQNTVFFASRWLPAGAVLLVLAWPRPRLRPALRAAVPYVVLASLTVATAAVWIEFEERELDGLREALTVPPGERLLGLDFVHDGERIKGFPYYHLYAYSQALHGGELARSFAELGSSLVVYRDLPRENPWTEALDWKSHRIRKPDMDHFQHVLIFGDPEIHARFSADERLVPVTAEKPWRLYRIEP